MSFAKKSFSILQRDLALAATNLISGILVARYLGPAALGIWVILALVPAYAEALGRTKADLASVYFLGKKLLRREDVLYNLNCIALAGAGLIVALILWQFEPLYGWLFKNEAGDYRRELKVLLLQIPLTFFYLNYCYFHISEENVTAYNRMVFTQAWVNSLTAVVLLALTPLGLWSVIFAMLLGTSSACIRGWLAIDRAGWRPGRLKPSATFAMLRYGANFYLAGLLGQLQQSGTRLVAVAALPPASLAFLAQGQGLGVLLQKIVDPMGTLLYPRISRSEQISAAETSCRAFRMAAVLMGMGGFGMAMVAEPMVVALYGHDFSPSASVLRLLLPGLVISGVAGMLGGYFNGTGQARVFLFLLPAPVMIQLLLSYMLLARLGLTGAALAISIGLGLYGISLTFFFLRATKTQASQLIPRFADLLFLWKFLISAIGAKTSWRRA